MTTTIVYAGSGDGYLSSSNAAYATAQAGSSVAAFVSVGAGYFGQNNNGGVYTSHQAFIRFTYAAVPATEVVTSAAVQVRFAAMLGSGVSRDLQLCGYGWPVSGLTTGDWRNAAALAGMTVYASFAGVNAAPVGSRSRAGSELLRNYVGGATGAELILVSSKQRSSTPPTSDEGGAVYLSGAAGTVDDPALVFTTVAKSRLFGVLGASTQLPDETWAYLENDGVNVLLRKASASGAATTLATVPVGTTSTTFAAPIAAQGFALTSDPDGNLYVVGRQGSAPGSVAIRCYEQTAPGTWLGRTVYAAALPAHTAPISQVAAAYVNPSNAPLIAVMAAHTTGTVTGTGTTDTAWVTFLASSLRGLGGSIPLAVGDASGSAEIAAPSGDFGGHRNEVGSGLDIAASRDNARWLYAASFWRGQAPGSNRQQSLSRTIFNLVGGGLGGFVRTDWNVGGYGVKDASAKMRTVDATGGVSALVTADPDSGYGIGVYLYQHTSPPGSPALLAGVDLAAESIASMPNGPAVGASLAWDAVYATVEGSVWVYYVDAANPLRVRRTSVSLGSYTATRQEVTVYTAPAGATIQAVRVPRGAGVQNRTLVQVAYSVAGVTSLANVVDSFNLAPGAPTLAVRSGFDAAQAASLSWTFLDPNPGDTQSAYQLQIEDTAVSGVSVVDTGKVVSGTSSRVLSGGTLTNGKTYQWRVRTYDALDAVGEYSSWATFTTAAGGTVTVTTPATDNQTGISTDDVQVSWSVVGSVQAAYRVWLYRGASLVSDSGWTTSTAQTYLVEGMTSDVQHEVRVQVRNAALVVSNVGTRLITPSYATPETPLITVTPLPDEGCVDIQVDNPAPGQPGSSFPEHNFEPGDAASYVTQGCTFTPGSTEQVFRGAGSGKIVAVGATAARMWPAVSMPITPGQRYTVRFWAWHATGRNAWAAIDWRDAGGVLVAQTSKVTAIPASGWALVAATGEAPVGATQAFYGARMLDPILPVAGETMYVDDLLLAPASDRPEATANEIYRRRSGDTGWELLGAIAPDGEYRDYTATGGVPYEYKVRATG